MNHQSTTTTTPWHDGPVDFPYAGAALTTYPPYGWELLVSGFLLLLFFSDAVLLPTQTGQV